MALHPKFKTKQSFRIGAYDIDSKNQLTPIALMRMMHEVAMQNSVDLGVSIWDLKPHGISWVLMRKQLSIETLPLFNEMITVISHPAGFNKFFTYRDYLVYNEEGALIATANTTWLLMDLKKRKMTQIPTFISQIEMPPPDTCLPVFKDKISALKEADITKQYEVGWYHLDFNQHLNNLFYLQWILESLPDNILQNAQLKELKLLYKQEVQWKEKILCNTQKVDEQNFVHQLIRLSDNKEIALASSNLVFTKK